MPAVPPADPTGAVPAPDARPRVVVVGGGITGLSAAAEVARLRPDASVVVLEAADRVGGKLRGSEVGGVLVDEGADAVLARTPDAVDLARAAGLGEQLVAPRTAAAGVVVRGAVRPLPTGTVLGVPADLRALARSRVLDRAALARVLLDLALPGRPVGDDVAVGALVGRRLGRQVVERLVDPLLGGVYAGSADRLSLRATVPALATAAAGRRSLLLAARAARPAAPADGPVFMGLVGGLGTLPPAVAEASAAEVRLGTTVRELHRTPTGWRLVTGSAADPASLEADAVVLAVPAAPAGRLLRSAVPAAAAELAEVEYASVAVVTLVLDGPAPGRGSGYLVPAVEGRTTKAVTFTSRKWAHLEGGPAVVRASVGRAGETAALQRPDDELVDVVLRELADVVGPLPQLLGARVTRWGGGLPQYAVGHLDRVARVRAALAASPGLALAGAAVDGVGVPACVAGGRRAAAAVVAGLAPAREGRAGAEWTA